MAKKRMKNGIGKDLTGIAIGGASLGIAGGIAGAAGAPAGVATGIGAAAGFLPVFAGVAVLKHTKKTFDLKKRRR